MALVKCPALFDGTFKRFYMEYVESNLPRPERVRAFDKFLAEYLASENPAYIIRKVRDQERGRVCTTVQGDQTIPSDNSPGWWMHSFLLGDTPIEGNAAEFIARIPTHLFKVSRMETLNTAGYHLAHVFPVKNRDTGWINWTRSDLQHRFLLNIHPCNWFLLAKTDWQQNGEREASFNGSNQHTSNVMARFTGYFCNKLETTTNPFAGWRESPEYAFVATEGRGRKSSGENRSTMKRHRDLKSSRDGVRKSNRPFVQANLIGRNIDLEIMTCDRRFQLKHDELWRWAEKNTNVPNAKSWTENGKYSWPKESKDMLDFLIKFEVRTDDD